LARTHHDRPAASRAAVERCPKPPACIKIDFSLKVLIPAAESGMVLVRVQPKDRRTGRFGPAVVEHQRLVHGKAVLGVDAIRGHEPP
jgi:hypothetical protein